MKDKQYIKVVQVFESYPLFYQPYIPPVIEVIKECDKIYLQLNAFKGKPDKGVFIMPSYSIRQFKEKWYALTNKTGQKLSYAEIKYKSEEIDVVHLQHSFLFPKVKGLLAISKNERPKIIITLRGGDTYVKPWLSKRWQAFYKNEADKVDGFITMSQHQKQYLHEKWGVCLNKIHVIPISFGSPKAVVPKYPNCDEIKIISVFRMCWEKNIDGNLRTVKQLKEKGYAVQYDIYGDGPDSGQVPYLIDKYKLSDCTTYHGKIENAKLKEKLTHYDFFLQLSHSEALPTSVIEAQAVGIPAIVANSGGLPEAILDKQSGYCVAAHDTENAANTIVTLWKDKKKYNLFSDKAIKYANTNFTVEMEAKKIIDLYHYIVN